MQAWNEWSNILLKSSQARKKPPACLGHKTDDWVQSKINFLVDPHEPLLALVKRRKLLRSWTVRGHVILSKTVLQGRVDDAVVRKSWMDSVKEWTLLSLPELPTMASRRKDWKGIPAESSLMPPPPSGTLSRD